MRAAEIVPWQRKDKQKRTSADRLTQILVGAAFILVAALAAIGTDMVLRPRDAGTVAQAVGLTPPLPSSVPTLTPSPVPTAEATQPPPDPAALAVTPPARPPVESSPASDVTPEACIPPNDWTVHAVQSGNTLASLAERYGVRVFCREDEEYPEPLRHIPDPPICLYVRGKLEKSDAVAVAIVGARRCTIYGREQAYRFGYQLAYCV